MHSVLSTSSISNIPLKLHFLWKHIYDHFRKPLFSLLLQFPSLLSTIQGNDEMLYFSPPSLYHSVWFTLCPFIQYFLWFAIGLQQTMSFFICFSLLGGIMVWRRSGLYFTWILFHNSLGTLFKMLTVAQTQFLYLKNKISNSLIQLW